MERKIRSFPFSSPQSDETLPLVSLSEGFIETELKKDDIPIAGRQRHFLAPKPRQVLDLEVHHFGSFSTFCKQQSKFRSRIERNQYQCRCFAEKFQ